MFKYTVIDWLAAQCRSILWMPSMGGFAAVARVFPASSPLHGPDEHESGFRLDSAESLFQGGESGKAVIPGESDNSRLIQLIRGKDGKQMPPDTKLESEEISNLEKWVNDGALWPGYENISQPSTKKSSTEEIKPAGFSEEQKSFWSIQPLAHVTPPQVNNENWVNNDIDRFVTPVI